MLIRHSKHYPKNLKLCGLHNQNRSKLFIVLVLSLSGFNSASARAEDGRAILQKCLSAYQHLSSYEGKSVLKTQVKSDGKVVQSAALSLTMEMKRPNKLHITIMSPRGSSQIFSDGQSLIVFDASANQYTKGPSAATMEAMLPELFKRARVLALIDPLGFMSRPQLPKELTNILSLPDSTFNGHTVYVISGQTKTPAHTLKNTVGKSVTIPATFQNWKWWIDKSTLLFDKIEIENPNIMLRRFKREGKKISSVMKKAVSMMKNTLADCKPDAPVPDQRFTFTIPAGAKEHRSAEEILKGAK